MGTNKHTAAPYTRARAERGNRSRVLARDNRRDARRAVLDYLVEDQDDRVTRVRSRVLHT
jgi:hypothetical protein